jgi:hypothetical protein
VNGENIIGHGAYKGGQRYKCKACGRTFTERTNTPLAGLRAPKYIVIMAIVMYMLGLSVASIAIVVGKQVFNAFYVGARDRISAEKLFEMTVARIRGIPLLTTTDGNETYPGMVKKFLKGTIYAQVIKTRVGARIPNVTKKVLTGESLHT